jgi:hypothetical protein
LFIGDRLLRDARVFASNAGKLFVILKIRIPVPANRSSRQTFVGEPFPAHPQEKRLDT